MCCCHYSIYSIFLVVVESVLVCINTLFINVLRRLLPSTLFPYTTLFRAPPSPRRGSVAHAYGKRPPTSPSPGTGSPPSRTDRKSTRLNSSHVAISYAVFCLKKKSNSETKQSAQIECRVSAPARKPLAGAS